MALNLNPFGGGPLEGWSLTGCAIFAVWGSEIIWLTWLTGTIYQGLSLLTHFARVLKWVNFWDPSSMVLKEPVIFSLCESMVLKEFKFGSFLPLLADDPYRRPLPVFLLGGGSWKESQILHFWLWFWEILMNGLERTQVYFSASSIMVCHQYLVNGLERSC